MGKKKGGKTKITFTVAECGEFHSLGEYYENIRTLEEAAAIYKKILPGRMNGIPSIGIQLHTAGTTADAGVQFDLMSGREINMGILKLTPESAVYEEVMEVVRQMAAMFPEKEIVSI